MPGTLVITDDWSGYASLRKRGDDHHAIAECGDHLHQNVFWI